MQNPGSMAALAEWFQTEPGRYVFAWEQALLDRMVTDIFGFHALQVGLFSPDGLRNNRMPHQFFLSDHLPTSDLSHNQASLALGQAQALPFESQTIDLLILPHVLEFSTDPHEVLREVERVLVPEGCVIITGFNPVSLWGLRQVLFRRLLRPYLPQEGEFISLPRLKDWLKLLGFELDGGSFGCYAPPCWHSQWFERLQFLENAGNRWWPVTGAVYAVSAVKRVSGMRLIGQPWKATKVRRSHVTAVVSSQMGKGSRAIREAQVCKDGSAKSIPFVRPLHNRHERAKDKEHGKYVGEIQEPQFTQGK